MTNPKLETIGQRIRWLREEVGMSQAALSRAIGIKPPSLSDIETGVSKSPAAATLLKIAATLEASPDWIMTGRGNHRITDISMSYESELLSSFAKLTRHQQAAILATIKALS